MSLDARRFAADVDRLLGRITPFGFAGAILVAHGDDVLLRQGYGLADRTNGAPNTAETVFCLGSITKQFTAAAVMALAQDGKLDPDDPLAHYLDGVPADKAGITLHHLLTHTAGVRNYTGPDYEPASREEMIARVMEAPLLFEPGSQYEYSNAGYSLLAAVVEIVAGQPFEAFLYERLLRPAGLEQTGYARPDWSGQTVARWYVGDVDNGQALEKPYPSWNIVGNGEMLSTLDDVFRWHQALLGDELLHAATKRRMYTPFLRDYAYGWRVQDTPYGRLISHNGASDLGSSALLRRYVDAGLALVLFCNQAYGDVPMILPLQDKLEDLLAGDEVPLPPEVAPAARADLAPYAGEHDLAGGGHLSLALAGDVLMLHAQDQRAINRLVFPDLPPEAHEALNAEHARVFTAALDGDLESLRGFLS
ncbi:MAG: serine hydrolase domain-containing protein, partial [Anaerolineae bacterium]